MMAAMPHLNLVKHRGEGHRRRGCRLWWMVAGGVDGQEGGRSVRGGSGSIRWGR